MFQIKLLGGFSISAGFAAENFVLTARQQSLLVYLLLHRHMALSRQQIAFEFWPDSTDAQAQANLRQLLLRLRRADPLLAAQIQVDAQSVQWHMRPDWELDVAVFEQAMAQAARAADEEAIAFLQTAVSYYTGDLFPDGFDEWIVSHRERLRRQFLSALQQIIDLLSARHELDQAITYAQRLIEYDPLHEIGYRQLMRLHALNHNRAAALRVYHACAATLRRELDVEPAPETKAQYELILNAPHADTSATAEPHPNSTPVRAGELLPLVGRAREWARLQRAWTWSRANHPHFVLIRGEAGMGKTRLLEEIARWAALQGAAVAQARAYMGQEHLAYTTVAGWLRSKAIQAVLPSLDPVWLAEVSRLLPELLAAHPGLSPPQPLRDDWQRQNFYQALVHAVLLPAARQPILLILDDLQWCDRETLSWLSYLLPAAANRPLLFIAAMRTGDVAADHPVQSTLAAWRQEHGLSEFSPRPLDRTETTQLAEAVAGGDWTEEEISTLYRETEGNPLFIVEMARGGREQFDHRIGMEAASGQQAALPPHMQAVIQARLHRLSQPARELAGLAAVIGREFRFDVLARASNLDDETLVRALDELWERRIIREQGRDAYDFSHDKLRAVSYDQISAARRRLLHGHVADAITALHADMADSQPAAASISAQLAHHYEGAGSMAGAIQAYRQAAQAALQVYANQDVVAFLDKALELLRTLPPNADRDAQELALLAELGPPLVVLQGYSAARVTAIYDRILELCDLLHRPADPRALRGLAIARILQGRHAQAVDIGRRILGLKAAAQDPVLKVEGHYAVGVAVFWQGEFASARNHLEKALAHFSPQQRHIHITRYAQDPECICLCRLAYTLWYLGYPHRAWQTIGRAISDATAQGHPFSRTYTHTFAALMAVDAREETRLDTEVDALLALTSKHRFSLFHDQALLIQARALARDGQPQAAVERMEPILQDFAQNDVYLYRPLNLSWLAQAYWDTGRRQHAQTVLAQALETAAQRGERYQDAELRRVQALWHWQEGAPVQTVAVALQKALSIAQTQGARILELRTLVTLYGLWAGADSNSEARQELARIHAALHAAYDRFEEGHDTPDLQAAHAILATD